MTSPKYNESRGTSALTESQVPPFDFEGVVMRGFPLRANLDRLAELVDEYLNVVPPEVAYFRPYLPYVYLMIIHYGKMAEAATNLGWVSQNEVAFSIPLEWYRRENRRLAFKGWAYVSPFIYVNDEMSMTTGREVYGWPKTLAWFNPGISPWTMNPRNPDWLLSLSTMTFPHLYSSDRLEPRVLVEINREPRISLSQFPPDPKSPLNPLLMASGAFLGSLYLAKDLAEVLRGMRLGFTDGALSPSGWRSRIAQAGRILNPLSPRLYYDTLNLKQFRDAEDPDLVAYQALISSRIEITRIYTGGLLGDLPLLRGDSSGGYRIKIHRYAAQPLVEALGLEVEAWEHGLPSTRVHGRQVTTGPIANTDLGKLGPNESSQDFSGVADGLATLTPVFPFWLAVDMRYGLGTPISWRTRDSGWHVQGRNVETKPKDGRNLYNTACGSTLEAPGPYLFPNTTLRVLPLLANPGKLRKFCASYLDVPGIARFEPLGSYVYMLIWNFEETMSRQDNRGWWAHREVSINIPVRRYDPGGRLEGLAMMAPYAFSDNDTTVATYREIIGIPMVRAVLESPRDTWMSDSGPVNERQLLRLETKVFPALDTGQKTEDRVLLEIIQGDVAPYRDATDNMTWRFIADYWGDLMKEELERKIQIKEKHHDDFKKVKALCCEILANRQPLNTVTLKQFREADKPNRASFQAVVKNPLRIDQIHSIAEIDEILTVRFHRYANYPIVETLGLKLKRREFRKSSLPGRVWEGSAVESVQPVRPFWLKVDLRTLPAKDICRRARTETWEECPGESHYFDRDETPGVGPDLVDYVNDDPERKVNLRNAVARWSGEAKSKRMTLDEARRALENVEPQVALESILSERWGQWRGQDTAPRPDFFIAVGSIGGGFADTVFPKEQRESDLFVGSQKSAPAKRARGRPKRKSAETDE